MDHLNNSEKDTLKREKLESFRDKNIFRAAASIQHFIELEEVRLTKRSWSEYLTTDRRTNQHCKEELQEILKDHPEYKGKKILKYTRHNGNGSTSIGVIDIEEDYKGKDGIIVKKTVRHYIKNAAITNSSNLVERWKSYNKRNKYAPKDNFFESINRVLSTEPCCFYDKETKESIIQHGADMSTTNDISIILFQNSQKTRVKTGHLTMHYNPAKESYFIISRDVRAHLKEDKQTAIILFENENYQEYKEGVIDYESEISVAFYHTVHGLMDLFAPGNVGVEYTTKEGRPNKASALILDNWTEYNPIKRELGDLNGWGQWIAERSHDTASEDMYLIPRASALVTGKACTESELSEKYRDVQFYEHSLYKAMASSKLLERDEPNHPLANKDGKVNSILHIYSSIIEFKQTVDSLYEKYADEGALPWEAYSRHIDHIKDTIIENTLDMLDRLIKRLPLTTLTDAEKKYFGVELERRASNIRKEHLNSVTSKMNWGKLEDAFFPDFSTRYDRPKPNSTVKGAPPRGQKRKLYKKSDFVVDARPKKRLVQVEGEMQWKELEVQGAEDLPRPDPFSIYKPKKIEKVKHKKTVAKTCIDLKKEKKLLHETIEVKLVDKTDLMDREFENTIDKVRDKRDTIGGNPRDSVKKYAENTKAREKKLVKTVDLSNIELDVTPKEVVREATPFRVKYDRNKSNLTLDSRLTVTTKSSVGTYISEAGKGIRKAPAITVRLTKASRLRNNNEESEVDRNSINNYGLKNGRAVESGNCYIDEKKGNRNKYLPPIEKGYRVKTVSQSEGKTDKKSDLDDVANLEQKVHPKAKEEFLPDIKKRDFIGTKGNHRDKANSYKVGVNKDEMCSETRNNTQNKMKKDAMNFIPNNTVVHSKRHKSQHGFQRNNMKV